MPVGFIPICNNLDKFCSLYSFVQALITKHLRPGGLNGRHSFSHSTRGSMPKIKAPAGSVSPEASLQGLETATSSLCLHVVFPLCLYVLISFSHKDTSQIELMPNHMTSFYLHSLFKGSTPKYSCILKYWVLELQHMDLGGRTKFSP